jgi:pimeloyl-ACP methyl ester carboxylesterase
MIIKNTFYKEIIIGIVLLVVSYGQAAAQTPRFTEQDVIFQNGSVELSGTLMLPNGQQKAPAVVFLHGSGPYQRSGFRPYAEEFAKLGVASLFFDKRGTGSSGGSWTTSSLDDLANDAVAAIEYLKSQEEIDPKRIGFWGISQAGWVAPLATSKSDDVAFMIMNSGGGASPKESEYFSYRKMFNHAGLSEQEKARAFKIVDQYFQYLTTGEGRPQLVTQLNRLESDTSDPLHRLPEVIRVPSEENQPNWSWVATYDPASDIKRFNKPILVLFGDEDTEHPVELAAKKWRGGLGNTGNDNATIMIFPGAGHGIRMGEVITEMLLLQTGIWKCSSAGCGSM